MPRNKTHAGPWTARLEIPPGLEDILLGELEELGFRGLTKDVGGIEGRLDAADLMKVQRWSRVAARATVRIARVNAPSLEGLASRVRKLPWEQFARPRQPLDVQVTSTRSRLRHRKTVAAKVELAIQDALKRPRLPGGRPPREPLGVGVRIEDDRATIRVDASGDRLHQRGWRKDPGRAPLRENLAVAVLRAANWHPGETLVDPMTGSGTFAVEAALWTLNRAPGARRDFACERWASWSRPKERRPPPVQDTGATILAADRDERSLSRARRNADRAGVAARIRWASQAIEDLEPPPGGGLVVINPPWGDRLGDTEHASGLHRRWRSRLEEDWEGYRAAVLVPDAPWASRVWGPGAKQAARFRSGGTAVCVWVRTPR